MGLGMNLVKLVWALLVVLVVGFLPVVAKDNSLKVGDKAPLFSLQAQDGRSLPSVNASTLRSHVLVAPGA